MSVRRSSVRPTLFSAFSSSSTMPHKWRPGLRSMAMAGTLLGVLFAAGNAHAAATTYTVNATTDTGTGSGTTGDLRYALTQAEQAANSGSTINITATGTITLTSALPAISQGTTITGPGASQLTISGANAYQVFEITAGTVAISGVTIANGKATLGAGITSGGTLTVSDCVFSGNSSSNQGGAIYSTGNLTVSDSAFLNNSAVTGGGIANSGTGVVTNSTFYGNQGGGISNNPGVSLTVSDSTFYGNSNGQGAGIENSGSVSVSNSIFARNSAGSSGGGIYSDATATIAKEENNLFYGNSGGDANVTLSGTDVTGQNPNLLPLGNYGGTTETMLPQPGSPAICASSVSDAKDASGATLTTDQRGFPLNAANCSNGGVDAGAVQTNYLMVTTATDSAPSSCTSAACSLRDAITAANTAGGDIGFKSSLNGSTLTLAASLPAITGAVNIIGPGANQLTISGGGSTTVGSVFTVNSGAVATLYGLTIANGNVNGDGGGIHNSGTLAVIASAVSGNTTNNGNIGGGGIYTTGTLALMDSTVSGNTVQGSSAVQIAGGGVASLGVAIVTNSTISGNTEVGASGTPCLGAGIDNGGTLVVTNSTISNNSGNGPCGGGGISVDTGSASLANSIVAGNTSGVNADINGTYTDKGGNLVGTSGINLAILGSYGGPTQTMLPLPGSPALCAGSSSLALDANSNALTTDQRGFALGAASYCTSGKIDAGAVQTNYTSAQFTNDTGYSALINQAVSPTPILSVTENGQNTGNIPVTLTFTGSGTPSGLGPVTTVAGTGATFNSIKVDTAGAADTLSVSLPVGTSSLTASANLEIDGPVALSPAAGALTGGSVGTAYSQTVSASGGRSPYTYALGTGALPDGLTLNSSTGVLSGTPNKAGSFSFSIQVTDKKGNTGSASYSLSIGQALTLVAVTSTDTTDSSAPTATSYVGDSVTFTASLTPVGKGVTFANKVAFTLDGSAVSSCSAQTITVAADGSSATATCALNNLTKGTHNVTASYPTGDANYSSAASPTFVQTVNLTGTSVTVASSKSPSTVDGSVKFTATVSSSGSGTPSGGTVDFTSDSASIGCDAVSLTVASGVATAQCSTSSLAAGSHNIVAAYAGDGSSFNASTSSAISQTVNKADTSVTVTSAGSTDVNQQVTLTATVTPTSPVALSGGTVAFKDNGSTISGCGTATVASNGQATCVTTFISAGSHTISAAYSGDSNYNPTPSGNITTLTQGVSKATATLSIASIDNTTSGLGANTSNLNDSVTFTATVAPATAVTGAAALSGKVGFTSNGKTLCAAAAGTWDSTAQTYQVTCTTSNLSAGTASIVATYSSDANYNGIINNLTQTVNTLPTTTAVTSSTGGSSTVNQSVTFTASVTPYTAATKLSGAVTFTYVNTTTSATGTLCNAVTITSSTGQAACPVSSLTPGSYTVTASYGNDSNYTSSSGTVAQTVGQATTGITLSSTPNPSTINGQVTLTAKVTAPSGGTALDGTVSFTDNGNAIASCPATTINPNAPTVVCNTSALTLGTHSLVANYAGDANFADSSSTPVTQTVNPAPTSLTIASSGSTSTVDQNVSFTATVSGASGATQFTGSMSFTDNGAAIQGCSALKVGAATGSATCSTSMLLRGSHTIAAAYAGDTNFNTSSNSLTQTVNPAASSITLVASPNPSIALNPKGYNDQVGLTATVGPSNGVPLSGAVTFTDNGAPIAECQAAVPVNSSTGTASCITSSLGFGSHTIEAAYNGDNNFTASSSSVTQSVQDYALAASPTSTVTVSQRFTNATDPFSPQPITVSASPVAGFTGQLALSCSVVPVSAPEGAVAPACVLGSSNMTITASAQQQPVTVTIDAGTGSTPVASTGTYNVSITGVDSATGLTRTSAAFVVSVRYQAPPLTIVSGATTGNTSTVQFTLPPNVGITSMQCASVTGPTLTSSVAPVALSMGCTFDPSTIAAASTSQDVTVTVAVSTSATTTAKLRNDKTTIAMAGMIGVPLLLLLGLMPGGKSSRKVLLRFMGIVFAVVLVLQATGCGGGQFTAPKSVSGQTPPGSYNILVQGTGTDNQLYQAVIQVNVTR